MLAVVRASRHRYPIRRAFQLGLLTGAVYFAGTLYWLVETMTTFGGLATPLAVFAAAVLVAYLSLFPGGLCRHLRQAPPDVRGRCVSAGAAGVGDHRARAPVRLGRLPLGAARLQPGHGAADRAGRLGRRRVRALGPAGADLFGGGLLGGGPTRRRWMFAGAPPSWSPGAPRGAAPGWPTARCSARGSRPRGGAPGQHRAGRQVEPRAARRHHRPVPVDDAEALDRRRDVRHLAGIVDAVLLRARPVSRWAPSGGWRARRARRCSSAATRSSRCGRPTRASSERYYNAAFLVRPDGGVGAVYRKMHLVPFGEYVPLQTLLFFVGPIVEAVSPFTPGRGPGAAAGRRLHMASTAICYEVIYPEPDPPFVLDGSELLTTITNDAWYGRSSAAYQHWDQARCGRSSRGATWRAPPTPGSAASWIPTAACGSKTELFEQASGGRRRPLPDASHDLQPDRRRRRLAVAGARVAALLAAWTLDRRPAALR
jgi:hypothetical protein